MGAGGPDCARRLPARTAAERTRQVAQLRKMADLVDAEAPDLETERLFLKDDANGLAQ
jgi:hypothetical protein